MKRLASLRRLQAIMQVKRAAEEAHLVRHQARIDTLRSLAQSAQDEADRQRNEIRASDALDVSYARWANHERHTSRERQNAIAKIMAARAEQAPKTARAVGSSKVVDDLIENELASLRQERRRRLLL